MCDCSEGPAGELQQVYDSSCPWSLMKFDHASRPFFSNPAVIRPPSWRVRLDHPGNCILPGVTADAILIHRHLTLFRFNRHNCFHRCHLHLEIWSMRLGWPLLELPARSLLQTLSVDEQGFPITQVTPCFIRKIISWGTKANENYFYFRNFITSLWEGNTAGMIPTLLIKETEAYALRRWLSLVQRTTTQFGAMERELRVWYFILIELEMSDHTVNLSSRCQINRSGCVALNLQNENRKLTQKMKDHITYKPNKEMRDARDKSPGWSKGRWWICMATLWHAHFALGVAGLAAG